MQISLPLFYMDPADKYSAILSTSEYSSSSNSPLASSQLRTLPQQMAKQRQLRG
jgi:hypothetical protein